MGYDPTWDQYRYPDLFARNLTTRVLSCNVGRIKWELQPAPRRGFEQFVPWRVAVQDGFQRMLERKELLLALDEDFTHTIVELPLGEDGGSVFRPFVFRQEVPQATTVVQHGLDRNGPVHASVYSLDRQTQWDGVVVEILDSNSCKISFEDPHTFEATIF